MKAIYLSKFIAVSTLLFTMTFLSSCKDSENSIEEPGTEIDGGGSESHTGNFDHQVTQPAPGGNTSDGGPQAVSNITSVSGVPLVRLNNGVMMPRFGLGTQVQSMEGANQRQQLNETVRDMVISALQSGYRHLDDAMFYYNERGAGWGNKGKRHSSGRNMGDKQNIRRLGRCAKCV